MEAKIIDEQLEDKQQIVTYKYLIEKLNIHPNKAKQLLVDYVSQIAKDKTYSITILIKGILKENNEYCIVLAYEDHVETVRRRFKQVDFEHIYSVQPISRFDDMSNALHLADSSLNKLSDISTSIIKKDKRNTLGNKPSNETSMEVDTVPSNEVSNTINEVTQLKNDTVIEKKLVKSQKKETGLDIFVKNNEKVKKVVPQKINSDFFSKFKKSNNSDDVNSVSKNENSVANDKIEDNIDLNTEISTKNVEENVEVNKITENVTKKTKKRQKDNEKKSKNKHAPKNKRKRIQTFDSSDEEINSEEEDKKRTEHVMDVEEDDVIYPTPPRPTPRESRKKEKQITTNTYEDEDGFVCTVKEVKMIETDSELPESVGHVENSKSKEINVEPIIEKLKSHGSNSAGQIDKRKGKNKQTKNTNQGMKQSSLTNFFLKQNK